MDKLTEYNKFVESSGELAESCTSAVDSWVTVRNGSPFPPGAVKVPLRKVVGLDDDHMPNAYVALWITEEEPVFGRAHNVDGMVVAYFPLCGKEWHSYGCGDFRILVASKCSHVSYVWVTPEQAMTMPDNVVREGGCCPALVLDCVYESPRPLRGDLLGSAWLKGEMAWTCFAGIERMHCGDEFRGQTVVLIRKFC